MLRDMNVKQNIFHERLKYLHNANIIQRCLSTDQDTYLKNYIIEYCKYYEL